jgi:hypothetical protein
MRILFTIFFLTLSLNVFAGQWYIVNSDKDVVATCNQMPDEKDLDSRGEIAVYSEEAIDISQAAYKGKKIIVKEKTAKQITEEAKEEKRLARESKIQEKMRESAIAELEAAGEIEAEAK